jgi:tetratricopeptide (TPR) repeat protein
LATVTLVGYVALTLGILFFFHHRGLVELAWSDCLLPSRWQHIPVLQGNLQIASAQSLVQAGKLREALAFAHSGLKHSPAHRDGRILFAQLLSAAGQNDAARDVLLAGFSFHAGDPVFLDALFGFLLRQQDDALVTALAWTALSEPSASDAARDTAALAGATARYFRGDYDHAENLLQTGPHIRMSCAGRLLSARIDRDRGHRDLALLELRALARDFPDDAETHAAFVELLRDTGRADEARRVSVAFQIAHPMVVAPRIELLRAYHAANDQSAIAREIASLLRDFPADPGAHLALADFAADTGDVALARRLIEHAQNQHLPTEPHVLLAAEAQIAARDYHGALETLRSLARTNPNRDDLLAVPLDSLQAVASLGAGDIEAARLFLAQVLNTPGLRAETLLALANRFVALDAEAEAHAVLAQAVAADPLNQAALSRLIELDLNANRIEQLPGHLQQLVQMRRPSPDILRVAQHKLGSDLFLFSSAREPALQAVRLALERDRAAPAPL